MILRISSYSSHHEDYLRVIFIWKHDIMGLSKVPPIIQLHLQSVSV
jgi:hypothetical protein